MKALLLFHFKAGVRLAMQSFTPVFCAALAILMLDIDAAGAVKSLARDIFVAPDRRNPALAAIAALAFLFAFSASRRLAYGANAWVRHMPFTDRANRRALAAALMAVQIPLIVALGLLGAVAHVSGAAVFRPVLLRVTLVLGAAAIAAMPVQRHWATLILSAATAGMALYGPLLLLIPAAALLLATDAVAGAIKTTKPPRTFSPAATLFDCRVALRALGHRVIRPYIGALVPVGLAMFFTINNAPPPALSAGAARLGGGLGATLLIAGMAARLSVWRPVWPWARSLPWSSVRRVTGDGIFIAGLTAPLLFPIALLDVWAAIAVAAMAPFLALRAAAYERISGHRSIVGGLIVEGTIVSALVCLVPWTAWAFLAAVPVALHAAADKEQRRKATRWSERHHQAAGDPLSWSRS